jgi:hypothetical protein
MRLAILIFAELMIVAAAVTWRGGGSTGVMFTFVALGVLLLVGTLWEHLYYKPVERERPSANWRMTNERFIDPSTGEAVVVYVDDTTGERRYVRAADGAARN